MPHSPKEAEQNYIASEQAKFNETCVKIDSYLYKYYHRIASEGYIEVNFYNNYIKDPQIDDIKKVYEKKGWKVSHKYGGRKGKDEDLDIFTFRIDKDYESPKIEKEPEISVEKQDRFEMIDIEKK